MTFNDAVWRVMLTGMVADFAKVAAGFALAALAVTLVVALGWVMSERKEK